MMSENCCAVTPEVARAPIAESMRETEAALNKTRAMLSDIFLALMGETEPDANRTPPVSGMAEHAEQLRRLSGEVSEKTYRLLNLIRG